MKDPYRLLQDLGRASMLYIRLKNTQRKCEERPWLFLAVLRFYLTPLALHKTQHSIHPPLCKNRISLSSQHLVYTVLLIKKHVLLLFFGSVVLPSHSKSPAVTFTSEQTCTSLFLIQEDRSTHWLPSQASTPGIMGKLHSLQAKSQFLVCGVAEKIPTPKDPEGPNLKMKQLVI